LLAIVSSPLPPSPPSNVVCPVFFVNSATTKFNFIRVSPPGWCHPGRSAPPPPPPPLSDAIDCIVFRLGNDFPCRQRSKWHCFKVIRSHTSPEIESMAELLSSPSNWRIAGQYSLLFIIYYLRQGGYGLPGVCLSVCLLATLRKNSDQIIKILPEMYLCTRKKTD